MPNLHGAARRAAGHLGRGHLASAGRRGRRNRGDDPPGHGRARSRPGRRLLSSAIVGPHWNSLWQAFRERRDTLGLDGVAAAEGEAQPLFAEIRRQGERREIPLLYHTVAEFALGHLLVRDGQVVGVTVEPPLELTAEVDAELAAEARRWVFFFFWGE